MEINTKYDLNQAVYIPQFDKETKEKLKCPICEGEGTITIKGKTFRCMECQGTGGKTKYTRYFVPRLTHIKSITIYRDVLGNTNETYRVKNRDLASCNFSVENIYSNLNDCKIACKNRTVSGIW